MKQAFVYMIRCEDNSVYTGITKDLKKRLTQHYEQAKECAKYTKSHRMTGVEAVFIAENWSEAARLEYAIKKLPKQKKETLIRKPHIVQEMFEKQLGGCRFRVADPEIYADIMDCQLNLQVTGTSGPE